VTPHVVPSLEPPYLVLHLTGFAICEWVGGPGNTHPLSWGAGKLGLVGEEGIFPQSQDRNEPNAMAQLPGTRTRVIQGAARQPPHPLRKSSTLCFRRFVHTPSSAALPCVTSLREGLTNHKSAFGNRLEREHAPGHHATNITPLKQSQTFQDPPLNPSSGLTAGREERINSASLAAPRGYRR